MVLLIISFLFNHPATTQIYTLSLHDALPISRRVSHPGGVVPRSRHPGGIADDLEDFGAQPLARLDPQRDAGRSEEHTSELQSRQYIVCRLLLEKKKYSQILSHAESHLSKE